MSDKPLTDICFENFDLDPLLLKGLDEANFIRCTPIQAITLPLTLAGKDVAGQAHTGTGKTAAFLVALFNRLLKNPAHPDRGSLDPRAVILAPTRELALQINKDAEQIGRHTGLKLALIYGGVDYDKQRRQLADGIDIVIATPGRLIDFVKQGAVKFRGIEMMIMDEADRMFDLGFIKDIRFLLRRMPGPSERQNLLFSATLSHRVLELAYEHMNEPEKVIVESETITVAEVRQTVYFPASEEKLPLLLGILAHMDANRSMVFVNTKIVCERVARVLERAGYQVGVLSGDVPQKKREKLLGLFISGELSMLVATDVAARGLHIPGVSHVFNYDLPFDAEDYVHRIGRTARLGEQGDAISFACDEYAMSLPDIEAFIDQKIPVTQFGPENLVAVPTKRVAPADGGAQQSVVEDAIADATAERKRRRERDRRDGRPGQGRPRRARSGETRSRRSESKRGEQHPTKQASTPSERAKAEDEHRPKRRRRPRRDRHSEPARQEIGGTHNDKGDNTKQRADNNPPKLRTRIKRTIKSLASRFGIGGRR
ncbi:MAG: DEAD/DEAH box helicase [Proteobacteria bacterium]|nr:MAG: DEAD/DEAH box helicase [Pseudomonadota bacterium]